jgi:hypothetical protein
MIDITTQLITVHGGNADLLARGAVMQQYTACVKGAQSTLNTGNEAAMATAAKNPTQGMTQMLGAGRTFQQDMAACAKQFPIK